MKRTVNRTVSVVALFICSLVCAQVPNLINYQGRVSVGSTNFDGMGRFKFALVDGNTSTSYWSNDGASVGGSEPAKGVPLTVSKGLYSVLLGDISLPNMVSVPAGVFNNSDVRLRVWFNDGTHGSQLLAPDQRIAAVGYAIIAGSVPDLAVTDAKISAVSASKIMGQISDAQISGLAGSKLTGAIPAASLSGTYGGALTLNNTSNVFAGDGFGLLNVNAKTLNGLSSGAFAAAEGAPSYIQNNTGSPQTASFNISGNALVGGTLSARLENSAGPPVPADTTNAGRIYFNTVSNAFQYSDGSSWKTFGARRLSYTSGGYSADSTSNGPLIGRTAFVSTLGNRLRITYTDNLGVRGATGQSAAASWEITVDGVRSGLKCSLYSPANANGDFGTGLQPHTIVGYINSVTAGFHQIGVIVSPLSGYSNVVPYTGWPGDSAFLLEVEEIIP